jgi:flagellar secretion chaperone FliS
MFASTHTPHRTMPSLANTYARVGVETGAADASPHKLITMLFDGFDDALARARGALASGQVEVKCRAISHAVRLVEEGLKAGLDLQSGGKLAADLHELYTYVTLRLTQANLHNDAAALDECARLLAPVRSAWVEIAPRVHAVR